VAALHRSRRTGIIVTAAVLVAILAIGTLYLVTTRHSTGSALGSSSSSDTVDPPVVGPPPQIVPLADSDKVPSTGGIESQLAGQLANPDLAQFTGIVIDPATGAVLWNKDSNTPQIPASTAKMLTGTAMLTSLDPTSRFVTKVVQGDQEGDIVLVGGGDVTLSARNEGVGTVYDGAPLMADLAAQVKASGVDVKRVVLDTDYWTGPDLADGWQTSDIRGTPGSAQGYITRMSPLMVDGDREDPANENSIRTGDPANTAGKALARLLGTPDLPLVAGTAPDQGTVIAQVSSQPMSVLLAQALGDLDPVHAGESQVEDHEVREEAVGSVQGRRSIVGHPHFVALHPQRALQHLRNRIVVLDDENRVRAVAAIGVALDDPAVAAQPDPVSRAVADAELGLVERDRAAYRRPQPGEHGADVVGVDEGAHVLGRQLGLHARPAAHRRGARAVGKANVPLVDF